MLPNPVPILLAGALIFSAGPALASPAAAVPEDPGLNALRRAVELRAAGDPAGAARALAPAAPEGPLCGGGLLEPWCAWHRGVSLLEAGDAAGAAAALARARALDPEGPVAARVPAREAEARLLAGDAKQAILIARGALARSPSPELRATLAAALLRDGQPEQARGQWRLLWIEHPGHPKANEAASRLEALGGVGPLTSAEHLDRSARLLGTGFKSAAIESARQGLAAAKTPEERALARVALGKGLWKDRQFEEAEQVLAAVGPEAPAAVRAAALNELGRSALARDAFALATERLGRYARDFPASSGADEAAFLAAWAPFNARAFGDCASAFDGFIEQRPRSKRLDEALWYAGFCRHLSGDDAGARERLERLARSGGSLASQAQYWRARLTSDPAAAEALYRRAIRLAPTGWYAWLARERLAGMEATPEPLGWTAIAPEPTPLEEARERRAALLAAAGLRDEARDELAAAGVGVGSREPAQATKAAARWASFGFHDQAYRLANSRLWAEGYRRNSPAALALLFPRAYRAEVEAASAAVDLDPHFVWAIMRRESAFDPTARSVARAHGLMQLLATNARKVAAIAGEPPPELRDLHRPDGIVPLAAWYLADLVGRFQHVALGAAAYNGGANNVARWVGDFGERPIDQFVELIPFKETRLYVKGVIGDYLTYRALYQADHPALPFPNAIPACGPNGPF